MEQQMLLATILSAGATVMQAVFAILALFLTIHLARRSERDRTDQVIVQAHDYARRIWSDLASDEALAATLPSDKMPERDIYRGWIAQWRADAGKMTSLAGDPTTSAALIALDNAIESSGWPAKTKPEVKGRYPIARKSIMEALSKLTDRHGSKRVREALSEAAGQLLSKSRAHNE